MYAVSSNPALPRAWLLTIDREGQYLGHATLLVPDGVTFKILVEVKASMRVEMLFLHKSDFDWLLTFYPPPMEKFRDELTDWEQLLRWISLPKVMKKPTDTMSHLISTKFTLGFWCCRFHLNLCTLVCRSLNLGC